MYKNNKLVNINSNCYSIHALRIILKTFLQFTDSNVK